MSITIDIKPSIWNQPGLMQRLKVDFSQKEQMDLSLSQPHEPSIFLSFKIWISGIVSLPASQLWHSCPYKSISYQIWIHPQFLCKFCHQNSNFRLWKVKGSCIWGNDKAISTFWTKATFIQVYTIKQVKLNFLRILQQCTSRLGIFRKDETSVEAFLSWFVIKKGQTYFMNVLL